MIFQFFAGIETGGTGNPIIEQLIGIWEDMPMEEAWMKFMTTGSVTDYLTCKGIDAEHMPVENSTSAAWRKGQDGTEYCVDRNGLKCDAGWRI